MGKGSRARPFEVPREKFENNWDKIFGKKDPKEEKQSQRPTDSKKNK
jgi:hypothetical protein